MVVTPDQCDIRFAIASRRFVDASRLELRCNLPERFDDCLGKALDRSRVDRDREPAIVTPRLNDAGHCQCQDHRQDN